MKVYNEIVMLNVDEIKPYFNNPRDNDKTTQALIKSIQKVGFNVPLLVDKNNVIVKGHSRFSAAKELGIQQVPCIISDATDEENNADRIYDNAIQDLSKWNPEKLIVEMRDISFRIDNIKFDIPSEDLNKLYSTGISQTEMENALKGFGANANKPKFLKIVCPACGNENFLSESEIGKLIK